MIRYKKGSLFDSEQKILVNAVNCFGAMGKGIALEFKKRLPNNYFEEYKKKCYEGKIQTGKIDFFFYIDEFSILYKEPIKIIANFPTKYHWKYPSKIEWIEKGLDDFVKKVNSEEIMKYNINGAAFPLLGCSNGGLDSNVIIPLMEKKLSPLKIEIEIWRYEK